MQTAIQAPQRVSPKLPHFLKGLRKNARLSLYYRKKKLCSPKKTAKMLLAKQTFAACFRLQCLQASLKYHTAALPAAIKFKKFP